MAFKQAFGKSTPWLPLSHCEALLLLVNTDSQYPPFYPGILMSIVMSSLFGHFFICTLIDAKRQVLWVMAFIRLTSMYFCCRSPWWSVFPFTDQDQQKPPFPDLHHQTAVGVTFSYAKNHSALFKNLAPYKCQSEKQAYAVTKENRKTLFIRRGSQSRCECSSIQVLVVSRMQLTALWMAFFIAARLQLDLK